MIERQRKTKDPCPVCYLHLQRCICALIPKLALRTRVSLVVHAKELKRTTNTGRLAVTALTNAQMFVRGQGETRLDLTPALDPKFETYVLYPSEDAVDVSTIQPSKPVHLIVPDGNWRQASKVVIRHPELESFPRVKVTPHRISTENLRKEHFPEGLATLEAIAEALAHFEGPEVGARLKALYFAKLKATLQGRGIQLL